MRRAIAVMICVLGAAASAKAANSGVLFRLNLPVGLMPGLHYTATTSFQERVKGRLVRVHELVGSGMSAAVLRRSPNGDMDIRFTITRMQLQFQGPKGAAQASLLDRVTRAIVGKSFTKVITPRDQVVSTRGLSELVTGVINALRLPPAPARTQIGTLLKQSLGESADVTPIFPENPVRVGESWVVRNTRSSPFPLAVRTRYQLVAATRSEERLAVYSTLATTGGGTSAAGMRTQITLAGTENGFETLVRRTGWLRSGEIHLDLSGKVTVSRPGSQTPTTVPMSIQTTITMG